VGNLHTRPQTHVLIKKQLLLMVAQKKTFESVFDKIITIVPSGLVA
jgi:hypothetical protein